MPGDSITRRMLGAPPPDSEVPKTIWEPPAPPRRLAWMRSSSGSSSQHKSSAHMVKKNEASGNSQTTPPPSPHLSRASTFRSGTTQKSGSGSSRSKTSISKMIPRSFLPRKREESDVKPLNEPLVAGPSYEQQTAHEPRTARNTRSSNRPSQAHSNPWNLEAAIRASSRSASTSTSFEEDRDEGPFARLNAGSEKFEQPIPKGADTEGLANHLYPKF